MRLVDNDIFEAELLKRAFLNEAYFVAGDADVEVLRDEPASDDFGALLLGTSENDDIDVRRPPFELASPVLQGRFWDDDQMGAGDLAMMFKEGKEGDGLQSFAEALRKQVAREQVTSRWM